MRDNRDFDESKLDAIEIRLTSENKFLSKLSNFWYYHKWKVLVIGFFAIIFAVGIFQMINKENVDEIAIIGVPADLSAEDNQKIDALLTPLMPKNADGSTKDLALYIYPIYSEDEMKAANESETDAEGKFIPKVLQSYNTSKIQEYDQFLTSGECSVMFVSEYLYERLVANGRVRPLSDTFGDKLPQGATKDGYGVRLGDTYFYEYFSDMQMLPEGTVVCILRQYVHGASSDDEKYAASVEFFKNIVSFGN